MTSVEGKVYRLRGIPEHLDRLGVAVLLGRFIPDGDQRDVSVASLASSCERWATIRTKTATLSFKKLPEATVDGKYQRSGPGTIFVSPASATGQRCNFDSASVMQINANHSDMVKFSPGSELIDRIAYKLRYMLKDDAEKTDEELTGSAIERKPAFSSSNKPARVLMNHVDPAVDPDFWDIDSIIQAIGAPERDSRLEEIDIASGHSFIWAFEKSEVGLTSWLQNDDKLFWISGKPASGKSTFMKYIYNNPLTAKYLGIWHRSDHFVWATFFFHHRGTAIQKSLEGLHRGILSQVLQQAPRSFLAIQSRLVEAYRAAMHANNLGSLSQDLEALVTSCHVIPDAEVLAQVDKVLRCEMSLKAFRTMVIEPMSSSIGVTNDDKGLLHQVYLRRDNLLNAYNKKKSDNSDDMPSFKDIVAKIEAPWVESEDFLSLLETWLEAINIAAHLSKLQNILMARGPKGSDGAEEMKAQLDDSVKDILGSFSARKAQQCRIETAKWSLEQLSHAVNLVANQQLIDLDICLFIDALDEHDGPPEFISRFIKDLVSAEASRTKLKMLFSSRPWQPFINAFEHSPHIQLHEFTENDIRELCLHTITRSDEPGSAVVLQLVEKIVNQARGVFLWVKLVLNDLLYNAAKLTASGHDAVSLYAALLDILKSLPTDLEQYYRTIIERIPYSYRWEAFCLLEAVSKSARRVYLRDMSNILLCAEAESIIKMYPRMSRLGINSSTIHYTQENLRTHSGGLVETVEQDKLQLLHQTLAEFIQLPEFKSIVLGDRCLIVKENGYTILAKYEALLQAYQSDAGIEVPVVDMVSRYAQEAESTTGNSIYPSFRGAIWKGPPENKAFPKYLMDASYTTLEVALACGLKLLQQDAIKYDKESRHMRIFLLLAHMIERETIDTDKAIDLLGAMAAQGLHIHAHYFGLLILMNNMYHIVPGAISTDLFQRAMAAFFQPGTNVGVDMSIVGMSITCRHFDDLMRSHGHEGTLQAIHIPTHGGIINYLLDNGVDPNAMTSMNMTPLDCWVKGTRNHDTCHHDRSVASLLIQRGGRLNVSTRQEWDHSLQLTIHRPLFTLPFPGWLGDAPGADNTQLTNSRQSKIRKWLGSLVSQKGKR